MNKRIAGACGIALVLVAGAVAAADPVRAGFEVALTQGEDVWRVNTVVPVEPDKALQVGLGPYVVSMTVKDDKGDQYTLQVVVTGQPGSATEKTEFLRRSFTGSHRKQLEFAAEKEGLGLNGVIFVGPQNVAKAK